jgi:hypothetical protein
LIFISIRVATTRLLDFGVFDPSILVRKQVYADLDFSLTFEIRSNAKEQSIFVLDSNYSVVTTQFSTQTKALPAPVTHESVNAVQKAIRWKSLMDTEKIRLVEVAKREGVSKGLVSQHIALLELPPRMLSFFRDGRDSDLKKPFSFREMQRLLALTSEQSESYFSARIAGQPLQSELELKEKAG